MGLYWQERILEQQDIAFEKIASNMDKYLAKQYKRCFKEVNEQMLLLYDEILLAQADGSILASDYYKYDRYYKTLNMLNQKLNELGELELRLFEEKLEEMYKISSTNIGNSLNFSPEFSKDTARTAINKIWCSDGKHWSNRIWNNKKKLQAIVEDGIIDCVVRGVSRTELTQELMKYMNVGFKQADRLARTELNYVLNQATYDKFQQAGIKEYILLTTDDDRRCEHCEELVDKKQLLSQAKVGINYPPLHPHCRCCAIAVIDKEGGQ